MLNRFHVWFPGGIVIGSLLAYLLMDKLDIGWQIYAGLLFIPLPIIMIIGFAILFAVYRNKKPVELQQEG